MTNPPSSETGITRDGRDDSNRSRRAFLATGVSVTAASLVGCLGGTDDDTPSDGEDGNDNDPQGNDATQTDTPNGIDEVVIGSVHPLSGNTAYVGERLHNAVDLATRIANEGGGIQSMDGAEINVISGDHKNDPATGGEVARDLIEQGADVLTGTYSSAVASSIVPVAEQNQVPFVIDIAADAAILQERDPEYVYRAQPNSQKQSDNTVEGIMALSETAGIDVSTAGLFYIDNDYGQSYRDGLNAAFDEVGVDVVTEQTIAFGGTADTQVTKFRDADPDVLVPTAFTNGMLELVGAMKDQDYWPKLFTSSASGGMNHENFQKMGDVINGALTVGYHLDMNQDRVELINERYQQTYDTAPMKANVGMAYSTGEVIVQMFEEAGTTDPDVLTDTLDEISVTDHVMAMPPIEFDEEHENSNGQSVTSQVQDLYAEVVYPEEYATAEFNPDIVGQD